MTSSTKGISLRVSPELYQRIEEARGQTPRERFCREAVEAELERIEDAAQEAGAPAEAPPAPSGQTTPPSAGQGRAELFRRATQR